MPAGVDHAKKLAEDAYAAVCAGHQANWHRFKTSVSRSVGRKVRDTLNVETVETGAVSAASSIATVAVTGTLFTGVAVLTGGAAVGVAIAIGLGACLIKKGIERYNGHIRNQQLARYFEELPTVDTTLTDAERTKKRGELMEVMNEDAKDCIRKSVVHMRKAINLYNTKLKTMPTTPLTHCEDAIARAKSIFKFIHEYDKFRNYLLPNLLLMSWILEDYKKLGEDWATSYQGLENTLIDFMGRHSGCGPECYVSRNRISSLPAVDDAPTVGGATPDQISQTLETIARSFRDKIVASKQAHRRTQTANVAAEIARWDRFRADLLRRYDEPSTGRQIRHFFTNRNMEHTSGEKFAFAFSSVLEVGGTVASPFIGNALESLSTVAQTATEQAIDQGQSILDSVVAFGAIKAASGKPLLGSLLLPPDQTGTARDHAADIEGDEVRDNAIEAQKMIEKVGTHWKAGTDALKAMKNQAPGTTLTSCEQAFELAKGLYEFHHHFRKMEKYLLAYYIVILRLTNVAFALSTAEAQAYRALETLKPFVTNTGAHAPCRSGSHHCYGPKYIGGGFFSSAPVSTIAADPHNPL